VYRTRPIFACWLLLVEGVVRVVAVWSGREAEERMVEERRDGWERVCCASVADSPLVWSVLRLPPWPSMDGRSRSVPYQP